MDNWKKNEETKLDWNPKVDENVNGDPFKTIFVTRLVYIYIYILLLLFSPLKYQRKT